MNPKVPKSLQNAPQDLPNPSEMLPKSTSDVTGSSLRDYVGPLLEKNLIFYGFSEKPYFEYFMDYKKGYNI